LCIVARMISSQVNFKSRSAIYHFRFSDELIFAGSKSHVVMRTRSPSSCSSANTSLEGHSVGPKGFRKENLVVKPS
jgi:hypothetical protein